MIESLSASIYVEPFGGPESLIFGRQPAKVETYNDHTGDLVNLFRVLRNTASRDRFITRLSRTTYSSSECRQAREILEEETDPEERAWALFILQNRRAPVIASEGNWGRSFTPGEVSNDPGRTDRLSLWHDRISRVQIDKKAPIEAMRYWDSEDTLQILLLPYPHLNSYTIYQEVQKLKGAVAVKKLKNTAWHTLLDKGWQYVDGFNGYYINEKAGELVGSDIVRNQPPAPRR